MSRLADVLAAHQWGTGICICGFMVCSHEDMAWHQAEAVAAAGLAVVSVADIRTTQKTPHGNWTEFCAATDRLKDAANAAEQVQL